MNVFTDELHAATVAARRPRAAAASLTLADLAQRLHQRLAGETPIPTLLVKRMGDDLDRMIATLQSHENAMRLLR